MHILNLTPADFGVHRQCYDRRCRDMIGALDFTAIHIRQLARVPRTAAPRPCSPFVGNS